MSVTREQFEERITVWGLIPAKVKERLFKYGELQIKEHSDEVALLDAKGTLLYKVHIAA